MRRVSQNKTRLDLKEKFSINGNPRKGISFSNKHREALSRVRIGFDSINRARSREKNVYPALRIRIIATNLSSNEELSFDSITDAARALNLQACNISRVLNGRQNRKQHKGWVFTIDDRGDRKCPACTGTGNIHQNCILR